MWNDSLGKVAMTIVFTILNKEGVISVTRESKKNLAAKFTICMSCVVVLLMVVILLFHAHIAKGHSLTKIAGASQKAASLVTWIHHNSSLSAACWTIKKTVRFTGASFPTWFIPVIGVFVLLGRISMMTPLPTVLELLVNKVHHHVLVGYITSFLKPSHNPHVF